MQLSVCTAPEYHGIYKDIPSVRILPFLPDNELTRLYQETELVVMPMLDCTSNDAVLEAMSCGTPVMSNRVGAFQNTWMSKPISSSTARIATSGWIASAHWQKIEARC